MKCEEFDLFMKNSCIGLLADCAFYCWQHHQITDEELFLLEIYTKKVYERKQGGII